MALPTTWERYWPTVLLSPISILNHIVTVSSTVGLHSKQIVVLSKTGQISQEFEIKRVLSDTTLHVGPKDSGRMQEYSNPVQFDGGSLAMSEQNRNPMGSEIFLRACYAEEPLVALRTVGIDRNGQYYTTDNPLPVQLSDGSINIENVNANVSVQLTHLDNWPKVGDVNDSVRIGDGVPGEYLAINPDGSINVVISSSLSPPVTPTIANVPAPLASTEYSYAFPANTKKFLMKVRGGYATAQVAYAAGTSSTNFITIDVGCDYSEDGIDFTGKILYFQLTKPGKIVEILTWKS